MIKVAQISKNEKENVFVVEFSNGVIKFFDTQMGIEMYLEKVNNGVDIMNKEIESTYDIVEKIVDEKISTYGAYMEVFDNETISKGRIYVKYMDDDENKEIINIVNKTIDKMPHIEINIDENIDMILGYLNFEFEIKIVLQDIEIEAIEDFEESLNNIEYLARCKEEEKEEIIMNNAIIDEYYENGEEHLVVEFEDEIEKELGGDWYCRASGGAFSSASDYWNYILG